MSTGETIVAISSAVGIAPRMIVRASGPAAHAVARTLCAEFSPEAGGGAAAPAQLRLPALNDLPLPIYLYCFLQPRSYTGEHLIEFHLPGNPLIGRLLLEELVRRGCRLAEAGEFTARAYFNGRMDLTAAEGVAATIAAANEGELRAARQLLSGELARRLGPAMELLAETLALVEVGIDFSEEDVSILSPESLAARIGQVDESLRELIEQSGRFETLSHEPRAVLIGRPNAGKSTLLNVLSGRSRAIVSPVAGTTRDALSAEVTLHRGLIHLVDVAGLEFETAEDRPFTVGDSDAEKSVQRQMRERALREMAAADLVLLVHDVASPHAPLAALGPLAPAAGHRTPDLLILTKCDLGARPTAPDGAAAREVCRVGAITISALTGEGIEALRDRLDSLAFGDCAQDGVQAGASLALNARHRQAINDARMSLARAVALTLRAGSELLAFELRDALDALGRILGMVSADDVLGRVFSAFCIGK